MTTYAKLGNSVHIPKKRFIKGWMYMVEFQCGRDAAVTDIKSVSAKGKKPARLCAGCRKAVEEEAEEAAAG